MFYNIAMEDNFENAVTNISYGHGGRNDSSLELQEANDTFPAHLRFNENSLTVVLVYTALFIVAAVGNLTVFVSLFRSRHRKSRISLMIRHLALADLLVTFIMIPLEVSKDFSKTHFLMIKGKKNLKRKLETL